MIRLDLINNVIKNDICNCLSSYGKFKISLVEFDNDVYRFVVFCYAKDISNVEAYVNKVYGIECKFSKVGNRRKKFISSDLNKEDIDKLSEQLYNEDMVVRIEDDLRRVCADEIAIDKYVRCIMSSIYRGSNGKYVLRLDLNGFYDDTSRVLQKIMTRYGKDKYIAGKRENVYLVEFDDIADLNRIDVLCKLCN